MNRPHRSTHRGIDRLRRPSNRVNAARGGQHDAVAAGWTGEQQVQVGRQGHLGSQKRTGRGVLCGPMARPAPHPTGNRAARARLRVRLKGWACATGAASAGGSLGRGGGPYRGGKQHHHSKDFSSALRLILTPACPPPTTTTTGRMAFAASRMLRRGLTAHKNLAQRVAAPAGICK